MGRKPVLLMQEAKKAPHQTNNNQSYQTMKLSLTTKMILAALVSLIAPHADAASFKLETLVPGYTGYVLVKPELRSVLGGRVRWNAALRVFETDRVSRGEKIRLTISPSTSRERCQRVAFAGVSSSNGFFAFAPVTLPYVENRFGVSTNPSFDNVIATAYTTSGVFELRLPIGRR